MALVLLGLTKCKICGEVIDDDRPFFAFPAVRLDYIDFEYQKYNDSVTHVDCLETAHENWEHILELFRTASARHA